MKSKLFSYLKIFLIIICGFSISLCFRPVTQNGFLTKIEADAWFLVEDSAWIIQTGKYILEYGIPATDIFSWTSSDKSFIVYQWLFEIIVAFFDQSFGREIMIKVFMLLTFSAFFILPAIYASKQKVPFLITFFVCFFTALFGIKFSSIRPGIISCLFLGFQYILIQSLKEKKIKLKFALPLFGLMYLIWGNCHTGVFLGLAFILIFIIGDILQEKNMYVFNPVKSEINSSNQVKPLNIKFYFLIMLLGFCMSLINPYGIGIYSHLLNISLQTEMNGTIAELQRSSPAEFILILEIFCLMIFINVKKCMSAQDFLFILILSILGLLNYRFLMWAFLFYAFIFPKALYNFYLYKKQEKENSLHRFIDSFQNYKIYGKLAILGAILVFLYFPLPLAAHYGICNKYKKAIETFKITENLFNDSTIGSCILLQKPQQKVFIDTRLDFYGQNFVIPWREVLFLDNPNWRNYLKEKNVKIIFIENHYPLTKILKELDKVKIIYSDEYSTIFDVSALLY